MRKSQVQLFLIGKTKSTQIGRLGKDVAKFDMVVFQAALLAGLHGITVKDCGAAIAQIIFLLEPFRIDEFGATNRNNMSERVEWAKYYVEKASSYGIPCVWWDNNQFGIGNENLGLINRSNNQVQFPELMAALLDGCKSRG